MRRLNDRGINGFKKNRFIYLFIFFINVYAALSSYKIMDWGKQTYANVFLY